MARQAAIRFGQPSALNGTEGASISHEMITGSPSVVVSTTSSHVRPEGTQNDPQDMELLTKPRGFFADQFEVGCRAASPITGVLLGHRCRTGATLMHTLKGQVQRYGDKQTASWMRSSRALVSRLSRFTCPSRGTEAYESRDGWNDRWYGSLYQVDGRQRQGHPGRSRGKRSLQQGTHHTASVKIQGGLTGRHSMTGPIWCHVRPQRSRRHKTTASS